ncbi:hypothetical protein D3C85_1493300 [compost metagenome]
MPAAEISRDQKYAGAELRYRNLPIPSQLADFLLPGAGVHLKQRHRLQVGGQFRKENRLLLP